MAIPWMLLWEQPHKEAPHEKHEPEMNIPQYPDGTRRTADGHPYDPDKVMPSSPVSPGTPQQPTKVSPMARLERMGFDYRRTRGEGDTEAKHKGHAVTESADLMGMVKAMKRRLDHMDSGEEFAKAGSDGLRGEELFKKLPIIGRKALKVLKHPPETWDEYLEDGDVQAIYQMEVKELERAIKEARKSGEEKNVDKEMSHVMAALLCMLLEEED